MKRHIALAIVISTTSALVGAQDPASSNLVFKTDRVVVFKDGYGLFMKSAKAHTDDKGRLFTETVPHALLGTIWASSADGKPVSLRSEMIENSSRSTDLHPATSMQELLRANVELPITIVLEKESITGTLKQIIEPGADAKASEDVVVSILPEATAPVDISNRAYSSWFAPSLPTPIPTIPTEAFAVITREDGNTSVVAVRDIKSLSGKDIKTSAPDAGPRTTRKKRLTFELGAASANSDVTVTILYLQEGIQWIPSYRVSGDLKTTASMALQGELINEAEDIESAAVDLVVGVPNFKFNDRVSPLALDRELRRTLTAPALQNSRMSQTMMNSQVAYLREDNGSAQPGLGGFFDPTMETQQGQDLFFYNAKDVSLKKGGRMSLPLWSSELAISHCYRFNVDAAKSIRDEERNANMGGESRTANPLDVSTNDVWHILEAKNETATPWTTGAALVLQDGLPISQDVLAYTPVGGTGSLPLTIAVDVRGEFRDEETGRQQNALNRNGTVFDLIKKTGTATVTNFRKDPVRVQVNISIGGKAITASDDGKIRLNDFRPQDWTPNLRVETNQHSDVRWEITLQPGQKKELKYDVEYYGR